MDTPITEAQAEQNLATTDFETLPLPSISYELLVPPNDGMTAAQAISGAPYGGSEKPINLDALEIEKLWAALDTSNDRINELYTRIDNFNVRASHKL